MGKISILWLYNIVSAISDLERIPLFMIGPFPFSCFHGFFCFYFIQWAYVEGSLNQYFMYCIYCILRIILRVS